MHTDILLEGTEKYYGWKFRVLTSNWSRWYDCYNWNDRINIYKIRAIEFAP